MSPESTMMSPLAQTDPSSVSSSEIPGAPRNEGKEISSLARRPSGNEVDPLPSHTQRTGLHCDTQDYAYSPSKKRASTWRDADSTAQKNGLDMERPSQKSPRDMPGMWERPSTTPQQMCSTATIFPETSAGDSTWTMSDIKLGRIGRFRNHSPKRVGAVASSSMSARKEIDDASQSLQKLQQAGCSANCSATSNDDGASKSSQTLQRNGANANATAPAKVSSEPKSPLVSPRLRHIACSLKSHEGPGPKCGTCSGGKMRAESLSSCVEEDSGKVYSVVRSSERDSMY